MYDRIKTGWERSSRDLSGTRAFWQRSALTLSLYNDLRAYCLRPEYIRGRLLDIGAGKLPYRHLVRDMGDSYESLDIERTHPDLDYVGDVQSMPVGTESFDTAIMFEVLEHVPDPPRALAELYRILRPGGHLVMSAPHMFYLHNEPRDYFRFTKYGLEELLTRAGFRVQCVRPSGGLWSFLQGLVSTAIVGLTYGVPGLWHAAFPVLYGSSRMAIWLDHVMDSRKLFALHYVAVAQKPAS